MDKIVEFRNAKREKQDEKLQLALEKQEEEKTKAA